MELNLYEKIANRQEKISVIGLGYVGLPVATSFSKKTNVIGFDINVARIELYERGIDSTMEVGDEEIKNSAIEFTSDVIKLREAKFHIVTVPTPIDDKNEPNLTAITQASKILGSILTKGSIVVYESTVYPGLTEEICIPILEQVSGLVCGKDFGVGYSPERINPGDTVHKFENITKVVSAIDEQTLDTVAKVYELVVQAGVYRAESIKVAEAAKVIENSQRDINIAFMNELSIIFDKMGIDTKAVLKAANTKWNFLNFTPGLVGGHCIGVDPYYLTYKANALGYDSQVILAGRRINDNMGKYIVENLVKQLIQADIQIKDAKIAIFGITFKENVADARNSKVVDIVNELKEYGVMPWIYDPVADSNEVFWNYGVHLNTLDEVGDVDAIIVAVKHDEFRKYSHEDIARFYRTDLKKKVIFDVKGIFDKEEFEAAGFAYKSL